MTIEMESVTCDTRSLVSPVSSRKVRAEEAKLKIAKAELELKRIAEEKALAQKRVDMQFELKRLDQVLIIVKAKEDKPFWQDLLARVEARQRQVAAVEPQRLMRRGFPHVAKLAQPRAGVAAHAGAEAPARADRIGGLAPDDAGDRFVHGLVADAGDDHVRFYLLA